MKHHTPHVHHGSPAVACALLVAVLVVCLASQVAAVTTTELASGLGAGVGIAYDPTANALYFVEYNSGTLRRMDLVPGCEVASPPTCAVTTLASGFSHPEDIALDLDSGTGYVTTRDDPGTSGALWKVDLGTGARSLVTFNLGAPQQLALDSAHGTAYVVGYDIGRLWKVNLTTGVKVPVTGGLGHPVGLAITTDRTLAYVTEQTGSRVAEIELSTGTRVRNVATGLTAPFFLSWSDPAETSLWVVQRNPARQVSLIDLVTVTHSPIITGLPSGPSALTFNLASGTAYVTTDSKLMRVQLAQLPMGEPVFLGVGHVPSTSIVDGYATTGPGYFFKVTHAPFGGTINILGNLSNFKSLGATHYRVLMTSPGGSPTPLQSGWKAYRWNPATSTYELTPVGPVPGGGGYYAIPPEYPGAPYRWYPSFLMMRWHSSTNGLHTFGVELYKKTGATYTPLTHLLPAAKNSLSLMIDNSPVDTDVLAVRQVPGGPVSACGIVLSGSNTFDFRIKAYDPNHHLLSYSLRALWGHNKSASIFSDSYASNVNAEGPFLWSGVVNAIVPPSGWSAPCDCAYTFYLRTWKRTINGYNYIIRGDAHQSVTINITGSTCAP
ncbi:MAG: hypothetical protein GXP48_02090 [Acidobacteria bacterium]|nr:hypothetical protein [Acidobacteriota bacterium]